MYPELARTDHLTTNWTELANQLSGSSAGGSVTVVGALQGEQGDVARSAYWNSLRTMFILYTAVSGVGLLISPFVGQRTLSKDHKEHKTGLQTLRVQAGQEEQSPAEKKVDSQV